MVKQIEPIEKSFACRVYGAPVMLIPTSSLDRTIVGIKRRIVREENKLHRSVDDDFIAKTKENIRRLRIIRNEMKELRNQL
jgi:hypothetical protein